MKTMVARKVAFFVATILCMIGCVSVFAFASGTAFQQDGQGVAPSNEDAGYVVKSEDSSTLTFLYGAQPAGTKNVDWFEITGDYRLFAPPWIGIKATKAVFDPSFVNFKPTSLYRWFDRMTTLKTVEHLEYLKTGTVTSMGSFFNGSGVTSLDLSGMDLSGLTSMSDMFDDCDALTSLTLGKNSKLLAGTGLHGITGFSDAFWSDTKRVPINYDVQDESTSLASINGLLDALPTGGSLTMHYSSERLTYDANGGSFGDKASDTLAYLGGLPGEAIVDETAGTNFTPIPNERQYYTFLGYAASQTATEAETPTVFPKAGENTTFYAVWKEFEPYVVKSGTGSNIVLTFQYTAEPKGTEGSDWWQIQDSYSAVPDWSLSSASKVVIDATFKVYQPTSSAYWFSSLHNLGSIEGLSNINTQNLQSIAYMFSDCTSLLSLDLSPLNTSSVVTMNRMFEGCSALNKLTLSKTSKLKTGTGLNGLSGSTNPFWIYAINQAVSYNTTDAQAIANINAILDSSKDASSTFTRASVCITYNANGGYFGSASTTTSYLYGNENDSITVSGKDYTPVPVLSGSKYLGYSKTQGSSTLETPSIFPGQNITYYAVWGTAGPYVVKSGQGQDAVLTFQYGDQPAGAEGTDWWHVVNEYTSAPGWTAVTAKKIVIEATFAAYRPASTAYWFAQMSSLVQFDNISNLKTDQVQNMNNMFNGCSSLQSLDLSSFDTNKVGNMNDMFHNCSLLNTLVLGKNTKLKAGTDLPGLARSSTPFWIISITNAVSYNTTDQVACDNISRVLDALPTGATQTFTKAAVCITYDADGGYFGGDPAINQSFLFGNANDPITIDGTDYTPVPVKQNYIYAGYAASQGSTTVATPQIFPDASSKLYAIWTVPSPYVVKRTQGSNTTLTFQFGEMPTGTEGTDWWKVDSSYVGAPGWSSTNATNVVIDSSFTKYQPSSMAYWFSDLLKVAHIENLSNIKIANVSSMFALFRGCASLQSLDLSSFATSNIVNMNEMFLGCEALSSLTLGKATTLLAGTGLRGLSGTEDAFWRLSMQNALNYNVQDENASLEAIKAVLQNLPEGETQTFTYATMRLTYNAQGGHFGDDEAATEAFLYGNPGEAISSDQGEGFNYTPIPSRADYDYVGYAATEGTSDVATPSVFPAAGENTVFYAVWQKHPYVVKSEGDDGVALTFRYGGQPEGSEKSDW